jgi:hypothetical protein
MAIKKQKINSNKIKISNQTLSIKSFEKPVFSFFNMKNGKYHIDKCNKEQKASLALKLSKIGQLTWQELKTIQKHGLGYEFIDRGSITGDNLTNLTDDIKLIAFRFWKKAPMVGYRCANGAFHILWLDKDFSLYNH